MWLHFSQSYFSLVFISLLATLLGLVDEKFYVSFVTSRCSPLPPFFLFFYLVKCFPILSWCLKFCFSFSLFFLSFFVVIFCHCFIFLLSFAFRLVLNSFLSYVTFFSSLFSVWSSVWRKFMRTMIVGYLVCLLLWSL